MNKIKLSAILLVFLGTTGCSYNSSFRLLNWNTWETKKQVSSNSSTSDATTAETCPNQQKPIGLQNLETREVVHCYANEQSSAEDCAIIFEKKGYVRFRDIPYKTSNYDTLKVDTYPTRRWRDSEITSRW